MKTKRAQSGDIHTLRTKRYICSIVRIADKPPFYRIDLHRRDYQTRWGDWLDGRRVKTRALAWQSAEELLLQAENDDE